MSAPEENQFWRLRSKHGRDKLFETSEMLWTAACEYFDWVDKHPWKKNEMIKGGDSAGLVVGLNTERPYTLSGLCLYLGCSREWLKNFEQNNKDSEDFMPIITCVRDVIYTQKFEGAAVGAFNPMIISRDLGLVDRQDVKNTGAQSVIIESANAKEEKANEQTLKDIDEN